MKLKGLEKPVLYLVFFAFFGTGTLLFVFTHWVRVATVVGEQHHPAEFWIRVAHSFSSYAGLISLGYLIPRHVLPGLKSAKRTPTGLCNLAVLGLLALSAIGILYSGEDSTNAFYVQSHSYLGFALLASLLLHLRKRHATSLKKRR